MKKYILLSIALFLAFGSFVTAQDEEPQLNWPREIETEENAVITLYQPQLESFESNILVGRMAVSVKPENKDLIFGALWFSARLLTDLENRLAVLDDLEITQTHFPDVEKDKVDRFARMLEEEIMGWDLEMSLDRLLASLEVAEVYEGQSASLNNEPPEIFFRTSPAILVYIDGDPILMDTDESGIKYVANTPYFLVKDTKKGDFYLKGAKWWYTSKQAANAWELTTKVPGKIKKLAKKVIEEGGMDEDSVLMAMDEAPELIVSTVPAELISTDGEPIYAPIDGTTLLYVDNTENDIIMDINSQQYYILLAGRWYTSKTVQDGDWAFAQPKDLPDDFDDIPAESPMANVRNSIPGTEEANIAVLEQTIPQTATVDRSTATVEVSYDGDPEFKQIEGTSMAYAVNCDKSVLLIDSKYYCVDNGIWFEAIQAAGPWSVSTERPEGVENIPPENPVYNVKYVYIYDYTPEVVYVGYTPGYTCSYVYSGVVVYGTGYWYRPWYRHYYYPRHVTWGFGVHYNPWTGWGFSVGVGFGWHRPSYGWWGPMGYQHGYRTGYNHGYRRGYHHGYAAGARRGYAAGQHASNRNVYHNRSNGVRSSGLRRQTAQANVRGDRSGTANRQSQLQNRANASNRANLNRGQTAAKTRPSGKRNDVFTDRSGNVQRRDQSGNWQNRSNGQWQQQSRDRSRNTQQMNRDHRARQEGAQRQRSYNTNRSQSQFRSSGSRSMPAGGARGRVGGRRR
ncbi:MAG: hypothetical protein ABFS05_03895 [Bacteroidota bacterium]